MAKAYGFGRDTGIDLPDESSGWVINRADEVKIWNQMKATYCTRAKTGYPDDPDPAEAELLREYAQEGCTSGYLYNGGAATMFGIGQGQYLSVSPLQLAVAYAAVANGGTVFHPRVAKAIVAPDGSLVQNIAPSVAGHLPVSARRPAVHPRRDDRRDPPRHGVRRVRRLPAGPDPDRRQDRYRRGPGPQRHLVVRVVQQPVRRGHLDPRHRPGRQLRGAGGAQGVRGAVRDRPAGAAADAPPAALPKVTRHDEPAARHPARRSGQSRGPVTLEPLAGPGAATSRARERSGISWRQVDWVLAFAVLALCVIGSLLIASATRQYQIDHHLDRYAYLKKHLLTVGIGAVLAVLVARSDFRLVRAYTPVVYLASLAGLVAVLAVGSTINGARSWIVLPAGFQLQPSELAKLALVVGLALILGQQRDSGSDRCARRPRVAANCCRRWRLAAVPLALVLLQPDFGTTMVLIVMVVGVLAVSGAPARWVGLLVASGVGFGAAILKFHLLKPYQEARLTEFLKHSSVHTSSIGYNVQQALIANAHGGFARPRACSPARRPRASSCPSRRPTSSSPSPVRSSASSAAPSSSLLLGIVLWRTLSIAPARAGPVRHAGVRRGRDLVRVPERRQHRHDARASCRSPGCRCRSFPTAARRCSPISRPSAWWKTCGCAAPIASLRPPRQRRRRTLQLPP